MRHISLALILALGITACGRPSGEADMQSDVDSLFLGYWLGMPRDSFYEHSLALNRQGLVRQGPQNQNIQYRMDSTLAHAATMLFYPDFHEERIARMRVRFSYDAWAPWNTFLSSDSLLLDVVQLASIWYGEGFEALVSTGPYGASSTTFTKTDGNRRVSIGTLDDIEVGMLITDQEAERHLMEARDEAE